jgi:predicted nucleic acid-binding protein
MLYIDTSAIVKKYVDEAQSHDVRETIARAEMVATCVISRAEAAAAFSKAIRMGSLTTVEAQACHKAFAGEWKNYVRIRVTEALVARADGLAWTFKLRGYDAVHLAAALEWYDRLGEIVVLATFDRELWKAAGETGLQRFPPGV